MKKIISISLVLISATALTAASISAFAETPASASAPSASAAPAATAGGPAGEAMDAKEFPARKAKILEHLSEHLAKVQQVQSCVQAANDFAALRACRPHGENAEHGGGEHPAG